MIDTTIDPKSDVFLEAPSADVVAREALDSVTLLASRLVIAEAKIQQLSERNETLKRISSEALDGLRKGLQGLEGLRKALGV